jgi:hypothetical protein
MDVPAEERSTLTVMGRLTAAVAWMRGFDHSIGGVQTHLSNAYNLAVTEGKSTTQIVALQHDFDALKELIGDQAKELIRKMAEVEAGSRG